MKLQIALLIFFGRAGSPAYAQNSALAPSAPARTPVSAPAFSAPLRGDAQTDLELFPTPLTQPLAAPSLEMPIQPSASARRAAAVSAAAKEAPAREPGRAEASREIAGVSDAVAEVRSSAGDIEAAGPSTAHGVGASLEEILSRRAARAAVDDEPFPGVSENPAGRGDAPADNDVFWGWPGGHGIDESAQAHWGDRPAVPAPPSGRRPALGEGGGWRRAVRWALRILAAASVFASIHYVGIPLAISGKVLVHGMFMHAAGALFLLPFAGDSSGGFLWGLFRSRWVRLLPGAFLAGLGAVVLGSGGVIPGILAVLGGWGLYRFGRDSYAGFPRNIATLAAFLGALGALTGAGLAVLNPGLAPFFYAPAAILLAYLPWRGGTWARPNWRSYLAAGWLVSAFAAYLVFAVFIAGHPPAAGPREAAGLAAPVPLEYFLDGTRIEFTPSAHWATVELRPGVAPEAAGVRAQDHLGGRLYLVRVAGDRAFDAKALERRPELYQGMYAGLEHDGAPAFVRGTLSAEFKPGADAAAFARRFGLLVLEKPAKDRPYFKLGLAKAPFTTEHLFQSMHDLHAAGVKEGAVISVRPDLLFSEVLQIRVPANPVLRSIEPVLAASRNVKINREKLREVAQKVGAEQLKPGDWKQEVFIAEDSEKTIDFFMLGNALNFKYWHSDDPSALFTTEYRGKTYDGAFAMWASLRRALDNGVPILDADYLSRITAEDVRRIFAGSVELPMPEERAAILREVGSVLKSKYGGHFHNLAKQAGPHAFNGGRGIVELLVRDFPSYNDVSGDVRFYKRAQLAVAMLYSRLKGTGLFDVRDIDDLTVFADYEVPKGLRGLGILEYGPELARKVDGRVPIARGSADELEIRANTLRAAELLRAELNRRGIPANSLGVDFFLWWNAQQDHKTPHHLTETTAY